MSLRSWKPCPFLSVLKFPNCLLDIAAWMHKQPQALPRTQFLISHHKLSSYRCHMGGKPKTLLPSWLLSPLPSPTFNSQAHPLSFTSTLYLQSFHFPGYRPPSLIQAINLSPEWLQQPCQLLSLSLFHPTLANPIFSPYTIRVIFIKPKYFLLKTFHFLSTASES